MSGFTPYSVTTRLNGAENPAHILKNGSNVIIFFTSADWVTDPT
jgi:hypothetical protein